MKKRDISLRGKIIYSVYLRNHTKEGTFLGLVGDLHRIKALGTDIIWLLPIHPIGHVNKKGSLGCPYSIRDYREVNPEYGTIDDFKRLVDEIHARGMICIIDVVYNHTSHDSVLVRQHPEYFFRKEDGSFGNRYGDWTDVLDLDYASRELWKYQIETLVQWAHIVDGFRCDVASCVPVEFWEEAVQAVAKVNPSAIWLAESVYNGHVQFARECGYPVATDTDLYRAFDMEYPYDVQDYFDRYVKGEGRLSEYISLLNYEEHVFPSDYIKIRFLENHDTPRASERFPDTRQMLNWLAFVYFQKGTTMLYGGQEWQNREYCTLFDKATFVRDESKDISPFMIKLAQIKKSLLPFDADFSAGADDKSGIVTAYLANSTTRWAGVFCVEGKSAEVSVKAPDGEYVDQISGKTVVVERGHFKAKGEPVIFRIK